jgi:KTSC domain-containing protein
MRRFPPIAFALSFLLTAITLSADPAPAPGPVGIVSRIKRLRIESTALATVGYSRRLCALEIEFRNGAIYRYLDVAPAVYEALLNARSKTRFYDQNIRRKYRSLHVRPRTG